MNNHWPTGTNLRESFHSGFIPSPIIFGLLIDSSCIDWHSHPCAGSSAQFGNCILYDAQSFRRRFHFGNAFFQVLAIASVTATFFSARKFQFPEEEEEEYDDDEGESGDEETRNGGNVRDEERGGMLETDL